MRISASQVAMEADHSFSSSGLSMRVVKEMGRDAAAALRISDEGRSYLTQLEEQAGDLEKNSGKNNKMSLAMNLLHSAKKSGKTHNTVPCIEEETPEIKALKYMLEIMKRWAKGDYSTVSVDLMSHSSHRNSSSFSVGVSEPGAFTIFGGRNENGFSLGGEMRINAADLRSPSSVEGGTGRLMTRVTASYDVINEREAMSFRTVGTALTEDGRDISFNVEFGMSRSFAAAFQSITKEDYSVALCDPLVINVGADTVDISDRKFFFDLDGDGKKESISGLSKGSGFLALDKNNDGRINDGGELFGTDSGDGFKSLSSYDSDKNGWIDENDEVFNRLKVWYNEGDGKEELISLKDAGVGAIYLGNTETEFSDKDMSSGTLNGIIRKTGIFLRENGIVGTLQHVDLAL